MVEGEREFNASLASPNAVYDDAPSTTLLRSAVPLPRCRGQDVNAARHSAPREWFTVSLP